jgi:hypothetical protein
MKLSICGFWDFLNLKIFSKNLVVMKTDLNTVPISSNECEHGFSQMNLILTSISVSVSMTTVSALLFMRDVGQPLRHFYPTKYIGSWTLRGSHFAVESNSKERARVAE